MSQLASGTRIGPYEIVAQIGAGGMGEVYRATDTRLKRQVALKVCRRRWPRDPDRLARFQREARSARLAESSRTSRRIYGLEESGGVTGAGDGAGRGADARRSHRSAGPIPIDEALPIARQIAEALEAAHEQGIIHRDLKPANIKLAADGDGEGARLRAREGDGSATRALERRELATSPTITLAGDARRA